MQSMKVIVLSFLLIMPGLAYGMGFNPFGHNSDNPPPPPPNQSLKAAGPASVPEPATALTVGTGLLALAAWRRFRS